MREKLPTLLAVALLVLSSGVAFAAPKKPSAQPPSAPLITFGNSAVPLTGPWKFAPGDSPWDGDTPQWGQPTYDDSKWTTLDLTPQGDPFNVAMDEKNNVPGWTANGF